MATITREEILDGIANLSVLELSKLVKDIEEKFGVTAAAPMMMGNFAMPTAAAGGDGAAPVEEKEEQTQFDVILTEIGANKISVIKAVRELVPSLGLKEAKDLVEAAPKPIKEGVPKAEADAAAAKLKDAGATAEIK
jgi:large subunit ribosomal protein L7/L12